MRSSSDLQAPTRPADGPRQYAQARRASPDRLLPQGRVSASSGDRCVELLRRHASPVVPVQMKCAKCGARGNRIDVTPNWKEALGTLDDRFSRPAMPTGDK